MNANGNRALELFVGALRLTPERWDDYLHDECGDDAPLHERARDLLRAHLQAGSFLDVPAVRRESSVPAEAPGAVIGPYKLLEQIGEGGMGLVFMAEQEKPIRRRVALKIIKPGMDTRQVVARFEAERQALALMDHPNIARILDAGTIGEPDAQAREDAKTLICASGSRPFFVMELVRGVPITEFCDQHRYTPKQRLALFVIVCQAVQHAHQKGIIHRDLKPSNILVTLHDTVAVPKIIDFGIAKALDQRLTERTLFTNFAQMIGTPAYMSPEQAEMTSLDVDTRSDVYALGVLLYELLTGTTPFDSQTLKQVGFDEMRRLIREDDPPRPSQRVSTLEAAALTTLSERRCVDGRRFGATLRGELDWVVMKALEKDRNRRYESAGALAADVQRYRNEEAVEACPPTAVYRLRTFAGRHKASLAAATMVAAVFLAATAVSVWQAVEANAARRLADERADNEKLARQEAAREAAVASAVKEFLQADLLRLADREVQTEYGLVANPNLTVRQALNRAAATVGQRFQDQPLVEAEIQATIGQAYMAVGEDEIGETHLARALALFEAHREPHHPQVLTTLDRLANVYGWRTGQWPRAIALRERAVAAASASYGQDHPTTIEAMGELGSAYVSAGRHSDGIRLLATVLAKHRASLGPDHPLTDRAARNLADRLRQSGRWQESIDLLVPLLAKAKATLGPSHIATIDRMDLLARAYQHVERLDEALVMLRFVLDVKRTLLDPEDGSTVHSMIILSRAYWEAGQPDNADGLLREAVRLTRTSEGVRGALNLAHNRWHLANNLLLQKRYSEAEEVAREALSAIEKHRPNDWNRFWTVSLIGGALLGRGEHAAAEPYLVLGFEGLLQREAMIYRPQYARLKESGDRLARLYDETGRQEKARAVREEVSRLP